MEVRVLRSQRDLPVWPNRQRRQVESLEVAGSNPAAGTWYIKGDAQVCSTALQAARVRFDTEVVHAPGVRPGTLRGSAPGTLRGPLRNNARVAQLAEAPSSEGGGWGFESLVGYAGPVGPVEWMPPRQGGDHGFESRTGRVWKLGGLADR